MASRCAERTWILHTRRGVERLLWGALVGNKKGTPYQRLGPSCKNVARKRRELPR